MNLSQISLAAGLVLAVGGALGLIKIKHALGIGAAAIAVGYLLEPKQNA